MVCMKEKKNAYRLLVRNPKTMRSLEDPCVDSRVTLKLILHAGGDGMDKTHLPQNRKKW